VEQSEKSIHDMETDFTGIEQRDEAVYKAASDGYYRKPELIRFLMAENLALKLVLFEKGLLTPEEHKQAVRKAQEILDVEVKRQINDWRKQNPQEAAIFDALNGGKNARRKPNIGD